MMRSTTQFRGNTKMKKFFATLMACVALCNIASAINPPEAYLLVHSRLEEIRKDRQLAYVKNLSYDLFKQYATAVADKICSVTTNTYNGKPYNELFSDINLGTGPLDTAYTFIWACGEKLTEDDLAELDTRFSELFKGKKLIWANDVPKICDEYPYFPKTSEVLFEEYDIDEFTRSVYRNRPRHGESPTREYMAARINKIVGLQQDKFPELKHWFREFFLKSARMRLRERSQGFVVRRDGSNPLQEVFDRASACVNAPHQVGLKEMIEEYAPGYKWVEVKYPSDMDIMVLVGDILNGKEAIDKHRGTLFFSLGADQYNEFVDRYNNRNPQE